MALLTFEDYEPEADDRPPFPDGFSGEVWMVENCERCAHGENTCPLLMLAIIGRTPHVWTERTNATLSHRWHCPEWTPRP
jgi:hypothetical protein